MLHRTVVKGLVLTFICFIYAGTAAALTINYNNFSDVGNFQLNGAAQQAGNVLNLTDTGGSYAGSAFIKNKVNLDSNNDGALGFSTAFSFLISDPAGLNEDDDFDNLGETGGQGADGIVFVIQNAADGASALGGGGGYLGYTAGPDGSGQSNPAITNSVGIEFDTWYKADHLMTLTATMLEST